MEIVEEGLISYLGESGRRWDLKLNIEKYFFKRHLYLEYEVNDQGIRPGQSKIIAVSIFPVPKNVYQVKQFLN